MRDKKGVDLEESQGGKELEGVEEGNYSQDIVYEKGIDKFKNVSNGSEK